MIRRLRIDHLRRLSGCGSPTRNRCGRSRDLGGECCPEMIRGIEKRFQPDSKTFSYSFSDEENPALD